MRKKYFLLTTVLVFNFVFISLEVFAQPILPSQPEQTPIDGGLGILAAAGGAYALKKLKDRKNSEID